MWAVFIVGALMILFFYFSHRWWQKVISFCSLLLLVYFLQGSHDFGQLLAKSSTDFYIPIQPCTGIPEGRYIIPNFYQGKAILVPVDDANKMTGEFSVKDLSELNCSVKSENTGAITK